MNERGSDSQMGEKLEGDIAGIFEPELDQFEITDKLDKLNALGMGRAFGHYDTENEIRTLLCYSIPVYKDLSQHVVIFIDGEVYVTEANGDINKLNYGHEMGPADVVYNFQSSDLSHVKRSFMLSSVFKSKVIMRSSNLEDIPEIKKRLEEALQTGVDLKQEKEEALRESPQMVIDTLDDFLADQDKYKKPKLPELPASFNRDTEVNEVKELDDIYDEPGE